MSLKTLETDFKICVEIYRNDLPIYLELSIMGASIPTASVTLPIHEIKVTLSIHEIKT